MKYRVKMEIIDGSVPDEEDKVMMEGVECEGFTLLAVTDAVNAKGVAIHHDVNLQDLAYMMASDDPTMKAAHLAKALLDVHNGNY